MTRRRDAIIEAAIERARRERLKLSATWRSGVQTSPATIKQRRLDAEDSGWVRTTGLGHFYPRSGLGHTSQSLGGLRRTWRDRQPPRSVVTELAYPNPAPGRPFPGAPEAEIIAWNLKVLAE